MFKDYEDPEEKDAEDIKHTSVTVVQVYLISKRAKEKQELKVGLIMHLIIVIEDANYLLVPVVRHHQDLYFLREKINKEITEAQQTDSLGTSCPISYLDKHRHVLKIYRNMVEEHDEQNHLD